MLTTLNTDQETNRYVIFFHKEALHETAKVMSNTAGIIIPNSASEAEFATASEDWRDSETLVVPSLGVAITSADPDQIDRLTTANPASIRYIRKEYIFKITGESSQAPILSISSEYLRGYRDGVNSCITGLINQSNSRETIESQAIDINGFSDNSFFSWGLQATRVDQTKFSGKGVRIAILDTGVDMNHPDFAARSIISKSFIQNIDTAQDDNGHGTHCLGTLAGPRSPVGQRRYGIACDAELFVGKVMNASGTGNEGDILHGIGWALQNQCRIISLSFGKVVPKGAIPDIEYEEIGAIALQQNCLLIAAAGNDSLRPDEVKPVNLPANSKTIMAVGAINRQNQMYNRSNGGIDGNGGAIDLVGPGVDVFSSKRTVLQPPYGFSTGTSMATPHVAGITALFMEADPTASAEQIWTRLTQSAQRLPLASIDIGSGLVQAPAAV